MSDPFYLTTAALGVAAVVGFAATRARQPQIVAYILVRIIVGPALLRWVEAGPLERFAERSDRGRQPVICPFCPAG